MINLNFGQKQMYWNAWLIHLFINSGPTPLPSLSLSQDISGKRSKPTELLQHAKLIYKTKEQNHYIFYADIALSCQIHSLYQGSFFMTEACWKQTFLASFIDYFFSFHPSLFSIVYFLSTCSPRDSFTYLFIKIFPAFSPEMSVHSSIGTSFIKQAQKFA